ncbi:AsmA family protein [Guyparkeria sp. 1SP6A2]|nr:AsmA family protein [Guyparkeria sp. 1SP6A2]
MTRIIRRPIRALAVGLTAFLAGLLSLAMAVAFFWPVDDLRDRATRQASDRLGMPVQVEGDVSLRFWPAPTLRATDVKIGPVVDSDNDPIARLDTISLSTGWWSLISGRLEPETLRLDGPVLRLTPGAMEALLTQGTDESPSPAGRDGQFAALDLHIREGEIHWRRQDGREMSITGFDLDLTELDWQPAAEGEHLLARTSFNLSASAHALRIDALQLSDVRLTLSGREGMFTTDEWRMTFLDSRGDGNGQLDFRASPPAATLKIDFDSLQLAELPEQWVPPGSVSGNADLAAALESRGRGPDALLRHLQGTVKLSGRDLRLRGVDLDAELAGYRRTQRFSLVDAGAVVFLGPVALLATKGSDFVRLLDKTQDKQTRVVHLVSDWRIEEGTARTRDVALSTTRNRVAAQASLDLPTRRINQATVAVVDRQGCPIVAQEVHGSFDAPQVEEPNLVTALLGAPIGLLRRGLDAISRGGESCEIFYSGSVAAPSE